MFDTARKYVYDRRRGLFETSVVLCGAYTVSRYVNERLEEVKEKVVRGRAAREALRRRFQSTHDDASFTIMALIPTLAEQILEEMDVESLTNELQSLSRTSRPRSRFQHPESHSESEVSSASDVHSDAGSASLSSYSCIDGETSSNMAASTDSWVDRFSSSSSHRNKSEQLQQPHDFLASAGSQLSDSITTASSSLSYNPGAPFHEPQSSMSLSMSESSTRTKAQLWKEVKILTLTRTLTTLYTTTLLSLLTSIQLALLARERYITSVLSTERAERISEAAPTLSGLIFREAVSRVVDVEVIWPAWSAGISEETEMRFLTLSWWILHVGWKDVAARVRGSVEAVFEGVSLKTKLSPSELHVLILDVRRRVERDGTGDNRVSIPGRFLGSLLPPTPETTAHVLAQGGALPQVPSEFSPLPGSSISSLRDSNDSPPIAGPTPRVGIFPTPPSSIPSSSSPSPPSSQPAPNTTSPPLISQPRAEFNDPIFSSLLSQTRAYLAGPDFAYALSAALDRATVVLVDGLRAKVFVDSNTANVPEGLSATNPIDLTVEEEMKEEIKIRLAGLLPGLARWSQLALNAVPNELVDNVMAVRELGALEAIVMSDYEDRYSN
ncbi:Peroxin-3-domain-containing protein [Suillus subalutaceus]|uniref:Peroxin-3-domain-containing protein n=1 Tax=Suillus subalutaceus TaxID=48586 RepID=UPI001B865974|nr:Peroxin-3-domain-containing protein [Suillus subalutaceus]KAG1831685.1 Peroxin-3-domain-containing protein [Suillus subalutaceus]